MNWLLSLFGFTPVPDVALWRKKWSTKIAGLQLSFAAALMVWLMLDAEIKASLPGWVPQAIGGGMLLTAFLVPLAVNAAQAKLKAPPTESSDER